MMGVMLEYMLFLIQVSGQAVLVEPFHVCSDIQNNEALIGKIAVMERGNCMFIDKVSCQDSICHVLKYMLSCSNVALH